MGTQPVESPSLLMNDGRGILVLALAVALLVALVEAFAAWEVTTVGQNDWVPAVPVIAISGAMVLVAVVLAPRAIRAAIAFVIATVLLGVLVAWWGVGYSLADKVAWDTAANRNAKSAIAIGHNKCGPDISDGLPFPGPYNRCTNTYGYVMYSGQAGNFSDYLLYQPGSSSPGLPDVCVRQLSDGWWAATNNEPPCPHGYIFTGGGP
jgi:hypothetical protein